MLLDHLWLLSLSRQQNTVDKNQIEKNAAIEWGEWRGIQLAINQGSYYTI